MTEVPSVASAPGGFPSPLEAVADMRATARWITAAAAAVGAALLGGAPLTAVGKVHGAGHIVLSFLGLALGLAGVGWIIWHTADAMIPPMTTLADLDTDPLRGLRRQSEKTPEAFFGPFGTSADDLQAAHHLYSTAAANLAILLAREEDPARARILTQGLSDARANAAKAAVRIQYLLELAHVWNVRAALRQARVHVYLGATATALGTVIFLTATRP
jgi:hypothetical protein